MTSLLHFSTIILTLVLYWMLLRSQKKTNQILLDYTTNGLDKTARGLADLHGVMNYQGTKIESLEELVNFIHRTYIEKGKDNVTIKPKGANRRPRTEAEKAQQAQIKKDWWAKKKAQEQNTPTPEAATSAKTPS